MTVYCACRNKHHTRRYQQNLLELEDKNHYWIVIFVFNLRCIATNIYLNFWMRFIISRFSRYISSITGFSLMSVMAFVVFLCVSKLNHLEEQMLSPAIFIVVALGPWLVHLLALKNINLNYVPVSSGWSVTKVVCERGWKQSYT